LSRKVFPVLIDYPELSPTRSAQYETAMKNDCGRLLIYHFYRKERRGLAQATPGKEAELRLVPIRHIHPPPTKKTG